MSHADVSEWSEVFERVATWPASLRIALAHRILDTLEAPGSLSPSQGKRGLSAAELQELLKTDHPTPDDETIKQWIDEHRMEKYGR